MHFTLSHSGLEDCRPLQVNVPLEMWTISAMKSDYRDEEIAEFLEVVKRASGRAHKYGIPVPAIKYGPVDSAIERGADKAKRPTEDESSSAENKTKEPK